MRTEELDAVVIGGGPAGAAYATITARAGLRVRVLEGTVFPRHHIGESLLAMSMPLLRSLGLTNELDAAGFLPKTGAVFVWGKHGKRIDLGFPDPHRAYQVPRGRFDQLLLDQAARTGAAVSHGQWAKTVLRDDAGRVCGLTSDGDQGPVTHLASLVVDASGLFQFLPRRLGLQLHLSGPRRVAISAYYEGAGRVPGDQATNIISEAARDGWLWFIPLDSRITSVGFVGDDQDLRGTPAQMLTDQIGTTRLVATLLAGAHAMRQPRLLRYTNHVVADSLWQQGYVLIGDTALFVDPLFSTGVHGALYGATLAAAATVSFLADHAAEPLLAGWYDQRMRAHYERVQSMVRLLYGINGRGSRFWRSRDLEHMSSLEAEALARALGPISIPLFRTGHAAQTLDIPPALVPLLGDFWTDPHPGRPVTADRVTLRDGVFMRQTLTRLGDRVVPALALAHQENRRPSVEVPAASSAGRLVSELSHGPVTRPAWCHDQRLTALVSVLDSGGLVRTDVPVLPEGGGR